MSIDIFIHCPCFSKSILVFDDTGIARKKNDIKNDFHYSADIFDIAQDKKSKLQAVSKRNPK